MRLKSQADKKFLELEKSKQDEAFKILFDSKQKEIDLEKKAFKDRQNAIKSENDDFKNQISKTQTEIEKLQKEEGKSPESKAVIANTISKLQEVNNRRKDLISKNNEIEKQAFETHNFNLSIEETWNTKEYELKIENLSRNIELERKAAEDSINGITSIEEAKAEITQMQYLKLSKLEFNNIRTLEDAKKALRENANRAYLAAQYRLIEEQSTILKTIRRSFFFRKL